MLPQSFRGLASDAGEMHAGGREENGLFLIRGFSMCRITRWTLISLGSVALAVSLGVVSASAETESDESGKLRIRNFDHFEFDTVTGSYFGVAGFYVKDDTVTIDGVETEQESATAEIRLLMGGSRFQGGLVIPYHTNRGDALGPGQDDIGDIRTHLKFIPIREDRYDFGGGLMVTFPGGGEGVGISTGETAVMPFVTGTGHLGPVDVNMHIGYNFITHHRATGAPQSFLYGGAVKVPVLDKLGLRLEFAGQQFTSGEDRNVVAVEPGLDYLLEIGKVDLQLSVAGAYGLSGGTAGGRLGDYRSRWGVNTKSGLSRGEWGAGFGIGVLWN